MTTEQKVALVASVQQEYGLAPALAAVQLPKSTWYYHRNYRVAYSAKYAHLLPVLETIARAHPEYGYRRTTEELQQAYRYAINHKVVQRLHQIWELRLMRSTRPPRPSGIHQTIRAAGERANLVAQLGKIGLFEVAYTDFTELRFADGQEKAYLVPIIGHKCKLVYGWAVGKRAITELALEAWDHAKETFQRLGISPGGMIIHHDRDPVFTGYGWTGQLLLKDRVRISYALRGARDNPEMEDAPCSSTLRTGPNWLPLWTSGCTTTIRRAGTRLSVTCRPGRTSNSSGRVSAPPPASPCRPKLCRRRDRYGDAMPGGSQ
jgi:hypothetical protein